jgi:hypothetical protein
MAGETIGIIIWMVVVLVIVLFSVAAANKRREQYYGSGSGSRKKPETPQSYSAPEYGTGNVALDGHRIPKSKDVTCEAYGHRHPGSDEPRYIVHDDPELGYVLLNGRKIKLEDCKYL